jgi:two-component system response regulator NreC
MSLRILLAEDHRIVREGLRSLIEKAHDMEVVGEAENGRMAVELTEALSPDIAIVDIGLPELNGIDVTRKIVSLGTGTKIIALSMHSDRRFVAGMFSAGASAYLVKESAFEELVSAIRAVVSGQVYLTPKVAGLVIKEYIRRNPPSLSDAPTLTPREREVLQLLAEGKSTKQIAIQLRVSAKTIETYRHQIMEKLGINSIAGLTKYAVREGLTSL